MGRKASVGYDELIESLTKVFRNVGYEAASLSLLEKATGLKKASLYHRFPQGKEQMAHEIIGVIKIWMENNILTILSSDAPPEERIELLTHCLNNLYSGGQDACIFNTFSFPQDRNSPFREEIKSMVFAFIKGLAGVIADAGYDQKESYARAERAVMLLQGSLVISRAIRSERPFRDILSRLDIELIG